MGGNEIDQWPYRKIEKRFMIESRGTEKSKLHVRISTRLGQKGCINKQWGSGAELISKKWSADQISSCLVEWKKPLKIQNSYWEYLLRVKPDDDDDDISKLQPKASLTFEFIKTSASTFNSNESLSSTEVQTCKYI